MRFAFVVAVLIGALVYLLRSRKASGRHRPFREVCPEVCFAAVIGGFFSYALEHPVTMPRLFEDRDHPPLVFPGPGPGVVTGRFVKVWAETCSEVANETTCQLKISPMGSRQVSVEVPGSEIRIWDNDGNQYTPASVSLGNDSRDGLGIVTAMLVNGVGSTLEFIFVDLDPDARSLPRVEVPIHYSDGHTERLAISFSEILG